MSTENAIEIEEPEYEGNHTHRDYLKEQILLRTGFHAHAFQLDAVLALVAGKDVIVHAGTGSGKTLIFAAPHFVQPNRTSVLVSPLILLQQDQQERMRKIGITAVAVNKEVHLEPKDWDDIKNGKYQIILLSPEMALHSEQINKVFDSKSFRNALIAMYVDEAHTISLWGGDFRKDYRGLGRIRARLPRGIPVSAVSATLRPKVKQDVLSTLGFSADSSKYVDINIGNERKNVYIGVRAMKFPGSSFRDLSILLPLDATTPRDIPKAIVYIDDVVDVTLAVITLTSWLHPSLQDLGLIMPVHAWMPSSYRSDAMARLFLGLVRIIICTEAAGMGCDIPDIERVIQYRMCKSADAFLQRVGRTARNPGLFGDGWLIAESWAWKGAGGATGERSRKSNDPVLLGLVSEKECRRKYLNDVYNNPPNDNPVPSHQCCDLCDKESGSRLVYHTFSAREPTATTRAAAVSGELDSKMLKFLQGWRREEFFKKFGATRMFGAAVLISDDDLVRVSRCAPIPSIEQLRRYLIKWVYVDTLLESMWAALQGAGFAVLELDATEPEDALVAVPSEPTSEPQVAPRPAPPSGMRQSGRRPLPLNLSASNTQNPRSVCSATTPLGVKHTPSQSTQSSHPPPTPSFPPPKRRLYLDPPRYYVHLWQALVKPLSPESSNLNPIHHGRALIRNSWGARTPTRPYYSQLP
ncbi:DEAD/DEAH-box helicase, partial [Rhizoctonia solani AG-3 Rhs1AP]